MREVLVVIMVLSLSVIPLITSNDVVAEDNQPEVDLFYCDNNSHEVIEKTIETNGVTSNGDVFDHAKVVISRMSGESNGYAAIELFSNGIIVWNEECEIQVVNGELEYKEGEKWITDVSLNGIATQFIPAIFVAAYLPEVAIAITGIIGAMYVAITASDLNSGLDKTEPNTVKRTTETIDGNITIIKYDGIPSILYYDGKASSFFDFEDVFLKKTRSVYLLLCVQV